MKGKVSIKGYKKNSPDRNNDYNVIPSGNITMFGVPHNVFGVDNLGNSTMMYPNRNYTFPGTHVLEVPIKQEGGEQQDMSPEEAAQILADGFYNGVVLSDDQANYLQNIIDSADQDSQEEFRKGGHHGGRTSKNIKSSVNELFLRNYQLYGSQGRHIYDPNVKDEGMSYISHPVQYWQHRMQDGGENFDFDNDEDFDQMKKGGNWIKGAINPKHKGWCTPLSNPHCTGHRRALALRFKHGDLHKQMGGEELSDYENNYFDNPFFQYGGVPKYQKAGQTGPKKVDVAPQSSQFVRRETMPDGTVRNYYKSKSLTPAQPQTSPGNRPMMGNDKWKQFLADNPGWKPPVKTPTTPAVAAQDFYTEEAPKDKNTSIPLNNEWLKDGKITGGTKYWVQYDVPDPSAGFSKATRWYIDPTTKRPIDTVKSLTSAGYNPVYIDPPANGYKSEKKRFDYADRPIVQTTAALSAGYALGGENCYECGGAYKNGGDYLRALVTGAYKDITKKQKGGESLLQGMDGDEYRSGRSGMFKNYLANNTMKAIAMEEIDNLEQLHNQMKARYGGGYYQQGGFEPADSLDQAQEFAGYYQQPTANTGTTSNPMPEFNAMDYLDRGASGEEEQVPLTPQQEFQSYMNRRAAIEPNADFSKPKVEFNSTKKKYPWGPLAAEGIIGGMNLASSFLNGKNTAAYNKWLNMQTDADHVFKSNSANGANRGMYETNTGIFKPDKYTPAFHKDGGETYMSQKQIDHLRSLGYKIEILD